MGHNHVLACTRNGKYAGHFAVKNGAHLHAGIGGNVHPVVDHGNAWQVSVRLLAKLLQDHPAGHRPRQFAFVLFEVLADDQSLRSQAKTAAFAVAVCAELLFDFALDGAVDALALVFLLLLGFAQLLFLVLEGAEGLFARAAVFVEFGLLVAFAFQQAHAFGFEVFECGDLGFLFGVFELDFLFVAAAHLAVALHELHAHEGLVEVLGCKDVHQLVVAVAVLVGLVDHLRVLVLELLYGRVQGLDFFLTTLGFVFHFAHFCAQVADQSAA